MWKLLIPVLLVAAGLMLAVVADKPAPKADLVVINRGDINTLDVQRMTWMQDLRVGVTLYEGLVVSDVFTWGFDKKPGMAERWEVDADKKSWTFHIRPDAKWSNGEALTARDFVYSWRRALLPDLVGDYINFFTLIEGGQEFYDWRKEAIRTFSAESDGRPRPAEAQALWRETLAKFDEMVNLKAVDDRTLKVRLVRPVAFWLDIVAFEVLSPVYGPLVDKYQFVDPITGRLNFESEWTKPPLLVSNGKFKLTEWRFKRDMRVERNEHYWNQAAINVDSIAFPSVEDPNAQVLTFQTGNIDLLTDVVPDYRAELLARKRAFYRENQAKYDELRALGLDPVAIDRQLPPDPRKNIHTFPGFGTYWYNFNCLPTLTDGRANPFADPRVRRAFVMAIDRQNIVDNIRRTGESVAYTIIPPGSLDGYTSPKGIRYDPVAAKALLIEAGYPDPSKFPTVEVLFNRDGGHDLIAQAVKRDWEQNLGVPVRLDQKEIKVFRNDLKNQNFMIGRAGWFGDYGDPATFLDLNQSRDGNNDRKYSSPVFDQLLVDAQNEQDPAKRLAILTQAEALLVDEDCPLIPIFHYNLVMMFNPDTLSGVSPHPRQKQHFYRLDKLGDGKGAEEALQLPARVAPAGSRGLQAVPGGGK